MVQGLLQCGDSGISNNNDDDDDPEEEEGQGEEENGALVWHMCARRHATFAPHTPRLPRALPAAHRIAVQWARLTRGKGQGFGWSICVVMS